MWWHNCASKQQKLYSLRYLIICVTRISLENSEWSKIFIRTYPSNVPVTKSQWHPTSVRELPVAMVTVRRDESKEAGCRIRMNLVSAAPTGWTTRELLAGLDCISDTLPV